MNGNVTGTMYQDVYKKPVGVVKANSYKPKNKVIANAAKMNSGKGDFANIKFFGEFQIFWSIPNFLVNFKFFGQFQIFWSISNFWSISDLLVNF